MSRKAAAKLSKTIRINQILFPLILISIAVLFPYVEQADCDPRFNCESCQDDGRCITCRSGFGNQSQTGYCEQCGKDCLACSPIGGNCTQCKLDHGPDFKSRDASCGNCSANCGTGCNTAGASGCDKCDSGYGLTDNGDCEACIRENCDAGCTVYGAGTCDKCNDGYGPSPATTNCSKCTEHCLSCPVKTSECGSCEFGYAVFDPGNKSCGACSKYCKTYGCFRKGPGACIKCDLGYEFFKNNFTCGECAANCSSCPVNGADHCDVCDFGFGLTANNTCERCSDNCTMYGCNTTGAHNCSKCDPGFGLFQNGSCGACAANCSSCPVNGAGHCDNCTFGYGLTPTNTCAPCSIYCKIHGCSVIGAGQCDNCDTGHVFYKNNQTCGNCAANCTSCPVNGADHCDNCKFGYGLTPTNTCEPCSNYCEMHGCSRAGADQCDACDTGYVYFNNNLTCGECSANCTSCPVNGADHCDNCTLGYGLTKTNTCEPCASNCTMYGCEKSGAGKCDRCNPGFLLIVPSQTCTLITTTALPRATRTGPDDGGGTNKYTTAASNNGSGDGNGGDGGGGGDGGNGSDTTTLSGIDVNGKTTANLGWNSYYSVSGLLHGTTPSSEGEIDWRILLTFLMLIFGGIFVTFVATLCWATRFSSMGLRRQRRRIYMKES